jgi:transposase-like protein
MSVIFGWLDAEKSVKAQKTARTTAALIGVKKGTAAYYLLRLGMIITQRLAEETPFARAIEVDKCYF